MNERQKRWVRIIRESRTELRVDTENSTNKNCGVLQTEQGAMIEVGAILGANVLKMNDGDILEIDLIMIRKEVSHD